jgi:hypothetical protein
LAKLLVAGKREAFPGTIPSAVARRMRGRVQTACVDRYSAQIVRNHVDASLTADAN